MLVVEAVLVGPADYFVHEPVQHIWTDVTESTRFFVSGDLIKEERWLLCTAEVEGRQTHLLLGADFHALVEQSHATTQLLEETW